MEFKYIIPEHLIKRQENLLFKVLFQTTNLVLWILLTSLLIFLCIFLNKLSIYGLDIARDSTIWDIRIFTQPLFSPLNWSSDFDVSPVNFIVNTVVFYALYSISFSVLAKRKVAGYILLSIVSVVITFWYYIYILSKAFV